MIGKLFSRSIPVVEQAAAWLVKFESGPVSESDRRKFVAWLKRSPEHIEEFLQLSILREKVAQSPALQTPLEELLKEARSTVIPLETSSADGEPALSVRHRGLLWYTAAAALVLLVLVLVTTVFMKTGEKTYRSEIGEQRSIVLVDGSVITLNTRSEVKVRFNDRERYAALVTGEALFEVSRDDTRPFKVTAGPVTITVTGTRFNVYCQSELTTITVLEGKISIASIKKSGVMSASAGRRLVVNADGGMRPELTPNPERAISWTERRLVFEEEPLSIVIAELNRYNRKLIKVDDPELASRPITGSFYAHDIDLFVAFLQNQIDVRVEERQGSLHVIARASSGKSKK